MTVTCVYTQSHEAQYERIDLSYRPNRRDNGDFVLPRTALTARNGNDALREAGASDRARFYVELGTGHCRRNCSVCVGLRFRQLWVGSWLGN